MMKTIGLIGGTSWVSTLEYYRLLNMEINARLGGDEAARCILYSLNFGDIIRIRAVDRDLGGVSVLVVDAARKLAAAGAECLVLCANTLHMFSVEVEREVRLPLVHIARATTAAIRAQGLSRVGLLGTRPTMEKDFYRRILAESDIDMLVPDAAERTYVDEAIVGEMTRGVFRPEVRQHVLSLVHELGERGAQGLVMACTEIPLLLADTDPGLPAFDTLALHVHAAVDFALSA
ncbi:MAG TPA: amino acid racemase [Candidatus Krumholzibacteria bacterium]|nr:amino acid racemase [Candidatus Krumholzibacteria bacterium]